MGFHYNSLTCFKYLEESGQTLLVFQQWFMQMENFKDDFAYRRNIFGLSSIITAPENVLPQIVSQKLPDVMNQLALLSQKMHNERVKTVTENEDYIKKGGDSSSNESWSDEEDEDDGNAGDGQALGMNDDSDDEDLDFKQ